MQHRSFLEAIRSGEPSWRGQSWGLYLLVLLGLLQYGGCGKQDRYEIFTPDQPELALAVDKFHLTYLDIPSLNNSPPAALAAWSKEDYLISLEVGQVFRVQGGHFIDTHWPGDGQVKGLLNHSDGTTWGVGWSGLVCTLENGQWVERYNFVADQSITGLLEDAQGRLVVFSFHGLVKRLENGSWQDVPVDDNYNYVAGWSHPDQGLFLVDRELQVFEVTNTACLLHSRVPTDRFHSHVIIEGDGQDQLAVLGNAHDYPWHHDGDQWVATENGAHTSGIFWQDHQLYGLGLDVRVWQDGQWESVADLGLEISMFEAVSVLTPTSRIIGYTEGGVMEWDGSQIHHLHGPLGEIKAVLDFQGAVHAMLDRGGHMAQTQEGWRWMGQPLGSNHYLEGQALCLDDQGRLLFLTPEGHATWDGSQYQQSTFGGFSWYMVSPQIDGSVFMSDSDGWARLYQGEVTPYIVDMESWDDLQGVVMEDANNGWMVDSRRLARMQNGQVETKYLIQEWGFQGLLSHSQLGLVLYGSERTLAWDYDGNQDLTPYLDGGVSSRPAYLEYVIEDGRGGLLAWEASRDIVMHYDGVEWTFQNAPGFYGQWQQTFFVAGEGSHFYLVGGGSQALRLDWNDGPQPALTVGGGR